MCPKCVNDWIFPPKSTALLPIFHTNCPDGSHFVQMGSHFAQNTTPTPVLYSAITHPFGGYVPTFVHKTPPTPPQNIPFPGLNWKEGIMNYHLGKMRPQLLVYVWKVDKALLIASLNLSIIHWSMSKNRVTNTVKAADVKTRVSAQISIKQHSHFCGCAQKLQN